MKRENGKRFYESNLFMWVCLIIFPPIGLILLWICHGEKRKITKIILTVVFALWSIPLFAGVFGETNGAVDNKNGQTAQIETVLPTEGLPQMTETVVLPVESQVPEQQTTNNVENKEQAATSHPPEESQIPSESQRESETYPSVPPAGLPSDTESEPPKIIETPTGIPDDIADSASPTETDNQSEREGGGIGGNGDNFYTYNNESQQQTEDTYVLNTSTMKFHWPSCKDVKRIAPENYATTSKSRDELLDEGYSPCGHCDP